MEIIKKYFCCMLLFVSIISLGMSASAAPKVKTDVENTYTKLVVNEKEWYKKVLKDRNRRYSVTGTWGGKKIDTSISDYDKYFVHDINKDGIKEIFLLDRTNLLILGYAKGKIKPLFYGGMLRFFGYTGKNVVFSTGSSTASTYYVYQLKESRLKEIVNFFSTTSSSVPLFYKINGKPCSKAAFYAKYNKYVKKAKSF